MQEYEVPNPVGANPGTHTVQLDDEEAKRLGLKPKSKAAAPQNKAAKKPANKSAK